MDKREQCEHEITSAIVKAVQSVPVEQLPIRGDYSVDVPGTRFDVSFLVTASPHGSECTCARCPVQPPAPDSSGILTPAQLHRKG